MTSRTLFLLGLVALGALVAPNASAQVPLTLEKKPARAFEMLSYNFTEYEIALEGRDYWLSLKSEAPERTEYWLRDRDGKVVEHADLREGGSLLTVPTNDTYFLQLNGRGLVALVLNEFVTQTEKPFLFFNITLEDKVAYSAARLTKTDHLCIDGEQPFDVEIWKEHGYGLADHYENVKRVRNTYDTRLGTVLVFVNVASPGWLRTAIGVESCEEVAVEDSTPTKTSEDVPGTPGFLAVLSLWAPLAAAGLVRRRNRRA